MPFGFLQLYCADLVPDYILLSKQYIFTLEIDKNLNLFHYLLHRMWHSLSLYMHMQNMLNYKVVKLSYNENCDVLEE